MLTREIPCRHCGATGYVAGRIACPHCGGRGFGVSEYASLRRSGMLRVRGGHGHGNRRLFAFFLCAIGLVITILGLAAREQSLQVLGVAMAGFALFLLVGAQAIAGLARFTRSRGGRIAICACLCAITALVLLSGA